MARRFFGLPRWLVIVAGLPVLALAGVAATMAVAGWDTGGASRCHGTVDNGSLENGRRLPFWGENYRAYSLFGYLIGRTFMHATVRDAILASYADVAKQHPEFRYVYAESGWPWGGRFAPHKTHRNGTAVDFHVPVRALGGDIAELPTSVLNQWGYSEEFDNTGKSRTRYIDFEAMAAHLLALNRAVRAKGISIRRVIFDVNIQPKLFATASGRQVAQQIAFNKAQAWVRHDEHYHVDFSVPCR